MKVFVPPIKSQGIKTKLVPWIQQVIPKNFNGTWVEPFMGTGVVAFNIAPKSAILSDSNPHLINFYHSIQNSDITSNTARNFLNSEGNKLEKIGSDYYYEVRERFNNNHDPLDFMFLNRSCFNGMIRFNKKGGFNVPFCKKEKRFAQSYVTKIANQIDYVHSLLKVNDFQFICQDFEKTMSMSKANDIIYCDPPYIGRHADYFNGWNEEDEIRLFNALEASPSNFILSTWHSNDYRKNAYIDTIWSKYNIITREHFYHVGGKERNRNPMLEALVTNLNLDRVCKSKEKEYKQEETLEAVE